jgi:hypothetical protein
MRHSFLLLSAIASITLAGALAEEKPAAGISKAAVKAEPEDFTIYHIL